MRSSRDNFSGCGGLTIQPVNLRVTSSLAHMSKNFRGKRAAMAQRGRPRTRGPGEPRQHAYREGKKTVSAPVTIEKWKKLRHVVTETQRPATDLINEAIDMLAEKYGEQPPQPTGRKTKRNPLSGPR
jgi:hypothetical protein